jgi:hypothetical protein
MTTPITTVPYVFQDREESIKLAQLDADFAALAASIQSTLDTPSLVLDGGYAATIYAGANFDIGSIT